MSTITVETDETQTHIKVSVNMKQSRQNSLGNWNVIFEKPLKEIQLKFRPLNINHICQLASSTKTFILFSLNYRDEKKCSDRSGDTNNNLKSLKKIIIFFY